MRYKLKLVFFAVYFLLAPLAGYYIGKEISDAKWHDFMERTLNCQLRLIMDNGVFMIPEGQWNIRGYRESKERK